MKELFGFLAGTLAWIVYIVIGGIITFFSFYIGWLVLTWIF